MSDTPKADAMEHSFATVADWFDFARQLERENAELRKDVYCCPPTSENSYEGFKWSDACEELENKNAELLKRLEASDGWDDYNSIKTLQFENAVLRKLLNESLDWLNDYGSRLSGTAKLADNIKAALRKETQS